MDELTPVRMLLIVVMGLLINASPQAKAYAAGLIKEAADAPPKFAVNGVLIDISELGITESATAWMDVLTPQ